MCKNVNYNKKSELEDLDFEHIMDKISNSISIQPHISSSFPPPILISLSIQKIKFYTAPLKHLKSAVTGRLTRMFALLNIGYRLCWNTHSKPILLIYHYNAIIILKNSVNWWLISWERIEAKRIISAKANWLQLEEK